MRRVQQIAASFRTMEEACDSRAVVIVLERAMLELVEDAVRFQSSRPEKVLSISLRVSLSDVEVGDAFPDEVEADEPRDGRGVELHEVAVSPTNAKPAISVFRRIDLCVEEGALCFELHERSGGDNWKYCTDYFATEDLRKAFGVAV